MISWEKGMGDMITAQTEPPVEGFRSHRDNKSHNFSRCFYSALGS